MEALRDQAGKGVEVGAGTGPDGLDGRGPGGVEPFGGKLAKAPAGPARESAECFEVGEEELLGSLRGPLGPGSLLFDP